MSNTSNTETSELGRLEALRSYDILDSLPEKEYDELTALAAEICGTEISLISLLDDTRQWFKSSVGLQVRETPKEFAFCAHAIQSADPVFMIQNAHQDIRFAQNPLVTGEPHISFYAGAPLITESGFALGTICVIDSKPKVLTASQQRSLQILASHVVSMIELRKKNKTLSTLNKVLQEQNEEFRQQLFKMA